MHLYSITRYCLLWLIIIYGNDVLLICSKCYLRNSPCSLFPVYSSPFLVYPCPYAVYQNIKDERGNNVIIRPSKYSIPSLARIQSIPQTPARIQSNSQTQHISIQSPARIQSNSSRYRVNLHFVTLKVGLYFGKTAIINGISYISYSVCIIICDSYY